MNRKVTVVGGAGNVGATVARGVADKAARRRRRHRHRRSEGGGRRARHAARRARSGARTARVHRRPATTRESANSDVVVITSGVPRKPGMSRDDLLNVNYKIMQQVTEQVVKHSPNCIIIPVVEPARRDGAGGLQAVEVPARARHRHGRRARLRAHARVHRQGAERVGRERPRVRARRPRRHDGAAAALFDGRRAFRSPT